MTKAIGVYRPIDVQGRIVIPKELRMTLNIKYKDLIEIFVDSDQIILKKYEPLCMFCGNEEMLDTFKGERVCMSCMWEMAKKVI